MKVRNKKRLRVRIYVRKYINGPNTYLFMCPLCDFQEWENYERGWVVEAASQHLERHHNVDQYHYRIKIKEI